MRYGKKGEAALPAGGRGVRLREPTRLAHIIEGFPPPKQDGHCRITILLADPAGAERDAHPVGAEP